MNDCFFEIEESGNSFQNWATLYMINSIFEDLMENNTDNLEERAFDFSLQDFIGQKI